MRVRDLFLLIMFDGKGNLDWIWDYFYRFGML